MKSWNQDLSFLSIDRVWTPFCEAAKSLTSVKALYTTDFFFQILIEVELAFVTTLLAFPLQNR